MRELAAASTCPDPWPLVLHRHDTPAAAAAGADVSVGTSEHGSDEIGEGTFSMPGDAPSLPVACARLYQLPHHLA